MESALCPTANEWINKCGMYTQRRILQPQRRMKLRRLQKKGWSKANIICFYSCAESRPKIKIAITIIVIPHDSERGALWLGEPKGGGKKGEVNGEGI
jgi:hypothetical protein